MVSVVYLLLPFASALVIESNTWGPSDSVHALDGVITAVNSIVNNKHLSAEQLTQAKQVAADIKVDIEAVEAGKLTKQQTKDKVGAAIKELTAFATKLPETAASANQAHINLLMKELSDKKKALAKIEGMMKLLKLKKALAEKKLMLEKLIMKKSEAAGGHKGEQEIAEASAVVSKLLIMAKNATSISGGANGSATGELPAPLKAIAATLQEREKVVSASLAKIVSEQTNGDAQIDAIIKTQMGQAGKTDFDIKKQKMFKHLKTEENRKFAKVRALRQN